MWYMNDSEMHNVERLEILSNAYDTTGTSAEHIKHRIHE